MFTSCSLTISIFIPLNSHTSLFMQVVQRSLFVRLAFNALFRPGCLYVTGQLAVSSHKICNSGLRGVYLLAGGQKTAHLNFCFLKFNKQPGSPICSVEKWLKENQTDNTGLKTEITVQVLNKYVVAVIIEMETYKNIE